MAAAIPTFPVPPTPPRETRPRHPPNFYCELPPTALPTDLHSEFFPGDELAYKNILKGPSTLPGAGTGAFAKVAHRKNKLLAKYHGGPALSVETVESISYRSLYAYSNKKHNVAVDPVDEYTGEITCLAAYINDPLDSHDVNAEFTVQEGIVYIKSICHIPRHSEIFLYYARDYWTNEEIPPSLRETALAFYDSPLGPKTLDADGIG
jgi:hypothetical protein